MRPNADARIFMELELKAQWSTCQRGRTAAAIVDSNKVIRVPAYNGTPRNQVECRELATPDERCQFCVHAERNAINHAAIAGMATDFMNIYTLKRPCLACSNDIIQAGIVGVFYREEYDTDGQKDYVVRMFRKNGIVIARLEMTPEEKSFQLHLNRWRETWDSNVVNIMRNIKDG